MESEIVSEAKRISKRNMPEYIITLFKVWLTIVLIVAVPWIIVELLTFVISAFLKLLGSQMILNIFINLANIIKSIIIYLGVILASPIIFGGINYFYNEASDIQNKESVMKYSIPSKLSFKQMWVVFLLTFNTFLGLIFFILPGVIYFTNRIMVPFILIDKETITVKAAVQESKKMMKNRIDAFIKIVIRIFITPILLYVMGTYVFQFEGSLKIFGEIIYIAGIVVTIYSVVNFLIAIPLLYNKIKGKKSGAIDVEFKEIKD